MQIEREDKGSAQSQPSPASPSDYAENGPLHSGGWRNIASAPRDGSSIDVSDRFGQRTTDVRWNQKRCRWEMHVGAWDQEWAEISPSPTHWMPLPPPPSDHVGGEG